MPRAVLAIVVLWFAVQSTAHACGNEPPLEELTTPQADREVSDAYQLARENAASTELLERSQQTWEEYRRANCELMSARDAGTSEEAAAQCNAFMARERSLELRLLSY